MNIELAQQILSTYEKHGWKLRRLLLRGSTGNEKQQISEKFRPTAIVAAEIDAEQPYALFETFEADETEEDREEARREMENRMREYALGAPRNNR